MADYSEDIEGTLDAIREDGAAIVFKRYPAQNPPTDPSRPYLGSPVEREDFAHFALIVPLDSSVKVAEDSFRQSALIPAGGLPFEVVENTQFELKGIVYNIERVQTLAPDGVPILYTCEVTSWPA